MKTVPRPFTFRSDNAEHELLLRAREMMLQSIELLKQSPPDTFLGRKHYDPIPQPFEDE